jgi:hypothetical protein
MTRGESRENFRERALLDVDRFDESLRVVGTPLPEIWRLLEAPTACDLVDSSMALFTIEVMRLISRYDTRKTTG